MNLSFHSEKPGTSPIPFAGMWRTVAALVGSAVTAVATEKPVSDPITLADVGRLVVAMAGSAVGATVLILLLGLG